MKLCMNLKLQAKKQIYYLTSLNYVVIIVFPILVLNRKTIFSKEFSNFLRLLLAFTKIFVLNDAQFTDGGK